MRQFAKQVAAHLVGWTIVRIFLDRLSRAYLGTDNWENEKKDIAVKVVAELESSAIVTTLRDPDAVADALWLHVLDGYARELHYEVRATRDDVRRAVRALFARLA